jgi:recombinational DNA repair protein RecR
MRWNIPEAEPAIESLANLPGLRLRFHLSNGRIQGMTDLWSEIHEAFDCERTCHVASTVRRADCSVHSDTHRQFADSPA